MSILNFKVILVCPVQACRPGESGTNEKANILEFNIDTARLELRYGNGEAIGIYTPGVDGMHLQVHPNHGNFLPFMI